MKMLTQTEHKALEAALKGVKGEKYIFGSRVTSNKPGGDIDILLLIPGISDRERFDLGLKISRDFKKICDEKIDIVILDPENFTENNRNFLAVINKTSLLLQQ
ncbi:MAG: nucleotidyltransferase domain-containing protein [Oligoflexia bacterium]|nr:nucleotidyltransferase domain-containing protein [Oligoflexia bacterium]